MLEECVGQLDAPFRRSEVVGWFRQHYPDVKETTLAAHIQAATANAGNRVQNHPYLGRRAPLLRRIDHGLYVRAQPVASKPAAAAASIRPGHPVARPVSAGGVRPLGRVSTRDRARSSGEALVSDFDEYVQRFEASAAFSGPSVYFHERAIERRRLHATVGGLLADERFLEYVYAVLPACGMHRMGSQAAKVCEFSELVASLRSTAPLIEELWPPARRGKSCGAALVWPRGSAREGGIDAPQLMLRLAASRCFTLGPGWFCPWLPGGPGLGERRAGRRRRGRWR